MRECPTPIHPLRVFDLPEAEADALQEELPAPVYGFAGRGSREQQKDYLKAVKRGYAADYDLLTTFFADALNWAVEAAG